MRHHVILSSLLLGVFALPLRAQATQKLSILSNDTSVTIERGGERDSCRVEVDGRVLAEREAKPICEQRERSITWNISSPRGLRFNFDSMVSGLPFVIADSMATVRGLSLDGREMARSMNGSIQGLKFFDAFDTAVTARPIIGVTVDTRARDTDRYGAYIVAVTPSGPADKAGLHSGDIITRLAGRSLTSGATSRAVSSDESRPYFRLIEVMATVKADQEIELEYRRGDANLSTKITPRDNDRIFAVSTARPFTDVVTNLRRSLRSADSTSAAVSGLYFAGPSGVVTDGSASRSPFGISLGGGYAFSGVLGSTELAPMNPKLGRYFGTESGVLIINTDGKKALGLEPGDVVQAIDGRSIDSPNELGRVLRSYEPGDRISIEVVRNKQSETVSVTLP